MYKQSVQVQVLLDRIIDDEDWHSEAEDFSKSLSRELTALHRELLKIEALSEATDTFSSYSKLLKRVTAEASITDELSAPQERYVRKVANFFYSDVWRYVALLISKNTVHLSPGDNDDKLLNAIDGDLQKIRGDIQDEIQSLQNQGMARDLYVEYIDERSQGAPHRDDQEFDHSTVEPWTNASAVPIRSKLSISQEEIDQ